MRGSQFLKASINNGPQRDCASCDDPEQKIFVGTTKTRDTQTFCNDCPNRKWINGWCTRTNCTADEFVGKDEGCYSCSEVKSIEIADDEVSRNKCLACPEREVTVDNQCRIRNCSLPDKMRLDNGDCHSCTQVTGWGGDPIKISSESEVTACLACNRIPFEMWSGTMICGLNCTHNTFLDDANWCRDCSNVKPYSVPSELYDLCNACPAPDERHVTSDGYCVLNTACGTGHFTDSKGKCNACTIVDTVTIGTHPKEQAMCLNCATSKRFFAGSSCYRCDTSHTPDVVTDMEKSACISCSEREVVDDKCVLKQ